MPYPNISDYAVAVQNPEQAFIRDDFKHARFRPGLFGLPRNVPGRSAVVFPADIAGQQQALRFFLQEGASSKERYDALHAHLRTGLADCVALAEWIDDAIVVGGRRYPMVRMQWIEGRPLDRYVDSLVSDGDLASLAALAAAWRNLVRRLQENRFAHGDLQHGNVLIDEWGRLRLVDFDGSWSERISDLPTPAEAGHKNYQPENRPWGRWMDTFSGLVVYTSLVSLSQDTRPWRELYNEQNLLFRREDFALPFQTPVWRQLAAVQDERLRILVARLQECCSSGWTASGPLEPLLPQVEWWERAQGTGVLRPVSRPAPLGPPPVTVAPQPPARNARAVAVLAAIALLALLVVALLLAVA